MRLALFVAPILILSDRNGKASLEPIHQDVATIGPTHSKGPDVHQNARYAELRNSKQRELSGSSSRLPRS